MPEFKGKTAFVTDGASGIGLAMAKAFAERGMNVVLADAVSRRCGIMAQTPQAI